MSPNSTILRDMADSGCYTLRTKDLRKAATEIDRLRAALEQVPVERECPNAGDESYSIDYGIGHGHICDQCNGTGVASYPWSEAVIAALATPAESSGNPAGGESAGEVRP